MITVVTNHNETNTTIDNNDNNDNGAPLRNESVVMPMICPTKMRVAFIFLSIIVQSVIVDIQEPKLFTWYLLDITYMKLRFPSFYPCSHPHWFPDKLICRCRSPTRGTTSWSPTSLAWPSSPSPYSPSSTLGSTGKLRWVYYICAFAIKFYLKTKNLSLLLWCRWEEVCGFHLNVFWSFQGENWKIKIK